MDKHPQVQLRLAIVVALAAMVLVVYWQTSRFDFTNWDDQDYVTANAQVKDGLTAGSIKWAFTTFRAANWHPLTWLSHMLDVQVFGLNPRGHHLTSVVLHVLNTILLFLVLEQLTGYLWRSAFVAALFAIHPLHVESVAWVAERKDVLSTLFWLLTMWAYVRYTRRGSRACYGLVIFFFALGLLAKPMLVTLPFVLLLLDYWPLSRGFSLKGNRSADLRWAVVREKIPLLVLTLLSCAITFLAQAKGGAVHPLDSIPVQSRIENAVISYVAYLGKMVWPDKLACFYPYLQNELSAATALAAFLVLVLISFLAYRMRRRRPYLMVGWLWYLGTLVPVIGLMQVGSQAMADRYTYIPLIGVFIIISWLVPELVLEPSKEERQKKIKTNTFVWRRLFLIGFAVFILGALMVKSYLQTGYWKNSRALFEHALNATSSNFTAHHVLGLIYATEGMADEAIVQLETAIRINDTYAESFNAIGAQYAKKGRIEDAIRSFKRAVAIEPNSFWHHRNLGNAYLLKGQVEEAITQYRAYAQLAPNLSEPHKQLGEAFMKKGDLAGALGEYRKAAELDPNDPNPPAMLGLIYDKQGKLEDAAREFTQVLKLKPGDFDGYNNLGYIHSKQGNLEDAARELQAAIKIVPEHPEPHNNLGEVYRKQKRLDVAEQELQFALKKDPNHLEARTNLGKVYLDELRFSDAIREFKRALKTNPDYQEAKENLAAALKKSGVGGRKPGARK